MLIIMTAKQSNLQRINRVMKFYYLRGQNRELVNEVYRKILSEKNAVQNKD